MVPSHKFPFWAKTCLIWELKRLKIFTSCNFSRTGTEVPLRRQTTAEYFQSFILKRGEISFAEAFDKIYNNW